MAVREVGEWSQHEGFDLFVQKDGLTNTKPYSRIELKERTEVFYIVVNVYVKFF